MYRKIASVFGLILFLGIFAAAQAVIINEVLYDTQGTDDPDLLYTELWGDPGTSLDDWYIEGINGHFGTVYRTVYLSGTIPADGYFVIGNSANVTNVDQVLNEGSNAGVDWENAGSSSGDDCDGLLLYNGGGELVDWVCYGPCETPANCEGEGGTNAPDPYPSGGTNRAIARLPDHQDTDDNGADFATTETLTPGEPNDGVACDPQYVILSEIRLNDGNGVPQLDGVFVIVRGIVNVDNYTLDSLTESSFYFQDDDAGCNVFRGSVPAGIAEGDCVEVSGWVDMYNGLTEITSSGSGNCFFEVEVLNHVDPPAPVLLTTQSVFEPFEGMLARIDNLSIVSGTWPAQGQWANLTVSDGNGTLTLRIDSDTQIDGTPAPDEPFSCIGIITQYDQSSPYDEGYQITPRYPSDIVTTAADEPGGPAEVVGEFRLDGAYPNPFNSTVRINLTVGTAQELTVHVFDLLGREVSTEQLTALTPGRHVYQWSPEGAAGLYFARFEGHAAVQTLKLLYLK